MSSTPQAEARPPRHPLLGELLVIPPKDEAEAVVGRMRHWDSALKPWDLYECRLAQGVARETIRQERHHQQEILLRHAQAMRAAASWDEDRRGEADRLAHGMARHPALIIPQLRRTRHGCALLAERWEMLRDSLDERGAWSAAERLLAAEPAGGPARSAAQVRHPAGRPRRRRPAGTPALRRRRPGPPPPRPGRGPGADRRPGARGGAPGSGPEHPRTRRPSQGGARQLAAAGLVPLAVQGRPPGAAPARPRRPAQCHAFPRRCASPTHIRRTLPAPLPPPWPASQSSPASPPPPDISDPPPPRPRPIPNPDADDAPDLLRLAL